MFSNSKLIWWVASRVSTMADWYRGWTIRNNALKKNSFLSTSYQDIPIIINNYNRLDCLKLLIEWLERAQYRRIFIIDNKWDYSPVLGYYNQVERKGYCIIRLDKNVGHRALWECNILLKYDITSEFVYTDSDVVPCSFCPGDVVAHLQDILNRNPGIKKAGLSLRLDNLPGFYKHRSTAISWEEQFWLRPSSPGAMLAPIDTTFALYRPFSKAFGPHNVRTMYPLMADHLGWHVNSSCPTEEDINYAKTAKISITNWNGFVLPDNITKSSQLNSESSRLLLLHLGSDNNIYPGWLNFDKSLTRSDILRPNSSLFWNTLTDIPNDTINGIYDEGFFTYAKDSLPFIKNLYCIAKHNCRYILRIPSKSIQITLLNTLFSGNKQPIVFEGWLIICIKLVIKSDHLNRSYKEIFQPPMKLIENQFIDDIIIYFLAVKEDKRGVQAQKPPLIRRLFTTIDSQIDFSKEIKHYML